MILPVLFAAFSPQFVAIDPNDPAMLAILRIVKNTPSESIDDKHERGSYRLRGGCVVGAVSTEA